MEYNYELLRKCHGLRFRATIANKPQEGIIKVTSEAVILCYGQEDPGYLVTFGRREVLSFSKETSAILPGDFEIVPRDPETYKDWQVGDKIIRNDRENTVIFRCGEVVLYKDHNNKCCACPYTCEELFGKGYRLVLTDIEQQIIEERKVVEDIEPEDNEPADVQKMISDALKGYIPEGNIEGFPVEVIAKMLERQYEQSKVVDVSVFENNKAASVRISGFFWADTVEGSDFWDRVVMGRDFSEFFKKYPKAEAPGAGRPFSFKKFDAVLVRDNDDDRWSVMIFLKKEGDKFYVFSYLGCPIYYKQCIPLNEDTEKLMNTTKKYEG